MRTAACWILIVGAAFAVGCAQHPVVLVREGTPPCPIVVSPDAFPQEQTAATELAGYLKRITGAEFAVVNAGGETPERAILVGPSDPDLSDELGLDGYVIRTEGQRLRIAGAYPIGTLYGAYGFLEDHLGCRWWTHNEEDVPELAEIVVPPMDETVRPPFRLHNVRNVEAQNKNRNFRVKARTSSQEGFTGSHSLYPLLDWYAKDHPEFYPMDKNGVRKANKLHFCYTADGIAEVLAGQLDKIAEKRGDRLDRAILFAGMGDWYGGMCQCSLCQLIYEEEKWTDPDGREKPGYSATLLKMINKTAAILDKKYPGVRVGTFAYMSLEAPPAKTVPGPNVVIRVPRLRHCSVHGADKCEKNQSFLRNLERWAELAPGRVYIWDYGASFKNFLYPWPSVHAMADNIKLYHRMGLAGLMIQGNYVTPGGDLAALKNYVWRRLMWDPALDTDAVIREFCDGYYGPAADAMVAYVDALEDAMCVPEMIHADEFAREGYLRPEAREKLAALRLEAVAATDEDPYLRRVKEATVGIEILMLSTPGLLEARDGRLVGKTQPADALESTRDLLGCVRNSGFNEWSSGRTPWRLFIQRQGGPLVTLKGGDVAAEVAPLIQRQLRQITWHGRPLLFAPKNAAEKAYPQTGGSYAQVGGYFGAIQGEPTATRLVATDEFPTPGWRFGTPRATIETTFEVTDEGAVTVALRRLAKAKPAAVRIVTHYALADLVVRYRDADGALHDVDLGGEAAGIPLEGAAALQVETAGARLTDSCEPAFEGAALKIDRKAGRLTATMTTAPLAYQPDDAPGLVRTIALEALDAP